MVGITRDAHYAALRYSESYRQAYHGLRKELGNRILERIADRAINGDPVVFKGEIVMDPATGKPLKQFDTVNGIFAAKVFAQVSDQPQNKSPQSGSQVQVVIHMPESTNAEQPPAIEINQADTQALEEHATEPDDTSTAD